MVITTASVRSGTAMLRMVTWWVVPVWAMARESSSVSPVSAERPDPKRKFAACTSNQRVLNESAFSFEYIQMSRRVMMMEKCTRWETSGRRSIWVPFVPVLVMADSRYVFIYLELVPLQPDVPMCDCSVFVLKIRAGAVRTAEGLEDKPMWTPMCFVPYRQTPLIDTEKTLYVN